jgi:Na+-driven multidrug efflux pump
MSKLNIDIFDLLFVLGVGYFLGWEGACWATVGLFIGTILLMRRS